MKKKYTSILLVLALCLTVTACGGKQSSLNIFYSSLTFRSQVLYRMQRSFIRLRCRERPVWGIHRLHHRYGIIGSQLPLRWKDIPVCYSSADRVFIKRGAEPCAYRWAVFVLFAQRRTLRVLRIMKVLSGKNVSRERKILFRFKGGK